MTTRTTRRQRPLIASQREAVIAADLVKSQLAASGRTPSRWQREVILAGADARLQGSGARRAASRTSATRTPGAVERWSRAAQQQAARIRAAGREPRHTRVANDYSGRTPVVTILEVK